MPDLTGRRILLVLATSTGGVGRHVSSLAQGLTDHGAAVRVAGPASNARRYAFSSYDVVEIGDRPHPVRDLQAARRLRAVARDVDLVHAHGFRAGALAPSDKPLVVTWHNALQDDALLGRLVQRHVARRADVTLVASADLLPVARRQGAPDVRLAPVAAPTQSPTGVDPGLGRPLVLAVGRLHPQKGYDVLIDALPLLGDVTVAVAGDGPLAADLRARAPQVRWLGRRDDTADLYAAADVVVLPSNWEARSLTAQEALRAGRPLVATDVGGTRELVGDGAVLIPPGDPRALAQAVRALLDDPVAAAALADRGRAVAAGWPSERDSVDQVADLYAELLG